MTKGSTNDLQTKDWSQHVSQERAAAPKKFSRPKKITLAAPLIFPESLSLTPEFLGQIISGYIEVTGTVPVDWGYVWPVPELYQPMTESGGKLYGIWFGFDTMEEALAVKSKFDAIDPNVDVWTDAEEQSLRRYLEEEGGKACPFDKTGQSSEAIYWSYRTQFRDGVSVH
jgi:hypothetical protein